MRFLVLAAAAWGGLAWLAPGADAVRFVILGDRTGSAQPGVYEQVWREVDAWKPAFVLNAGDTIEGNNDQTVDAEWRALAPLFARYSRYPLYFTPGNHDIWSEPSRRAYERYSRRPAHYGFDAGPMHITVLDNSMSEALTDREMGFLEADLERAPAGSIKLVVFHRPSWLVPVMLGGDFPLQRVAKKYGVRYIVSGHTHRFARFESGGVTYLMVGSSGGHLRASGFEDGWFFHHIRVEVQGGRVRMTVKETAPPFGQNRVFTEREWGSGVRKAS